MLLLFIIIAIETIFVIISLVGLKEVLQRKYMVNFILSLYEAGVDGFVNCATTTLISFRIFCMTFNKKTRLGGFPDPSIIVAIYLCLQLAMLVTELVKTFSRIKFRKRKKLPCWAGFLLTD